MFLRGGPALLWFHISQQHMCNPAAAQSTQSSWYQEILFSQVGNTLELSCNQDLLLLQQARQACLQNWQLGVIFITNPAWYIQDGGVLRGTMRHAQNHLMTLKMKENYILKVCLKVKRRHLVGMYNCHYYHIAFSTVDNTLISPCLQESRKMPIESPQLVGTNHQLLKKIK